MNIRVIIFEDNNSLRQGLFQLIHDSEGFECAGAFEDGSEVLRQLEETRPDVVLMDIAMPGRNGIEAVRLIRQHFPAVRILMQTIFEDNEKIFQSILVGASGYILKTTTPSRLLEFIRETFEGGAPMSPSVATRVLGIVKQQSAFTHPVAFQLSEREKEILSRLVNGMSYKLIAAHCCISIDTVRGHIRNIYDKLHVHSKGEAIATALKGNIL